MFQPQPMLLRLCSLALFRGLLGKPPLTELRRFCSASSLEEKVEAYASFAAAVYTAGGNLTSALRTAILEEENVYMLARAQKNRFLKTGTGRLPLNWLFWRRFPSLRRNSSKAGWTTAGTSQNGKRSRPPWPRCMRNVWLKSPAMAMGSMPGIMRSC